MLVFLISTILQIMPFQYTIKEDIPFSNVKGYWCESAARDKDLGAQILQFHKVYRKRNLELKMDIYCPDVDSPRPLVLLMHGGAFFANNKKSEPIGSLSKDLVEKGYVVASFDYRLGFHVNKKSIGKAGDRALEDAESALVYLLDHCNEYGIDPSKVFIGGASSGAITMLKLAERKPYFIIGLIDMWGGVEDLYLLDDITTPIIAFHGDKDTTVPYTEGYPLGGKILMNYMYGSKPLIDHLTEKGHDAKLITLVGYPHAPYRNKDFSFNENYQIIRDGIIEFLDRISK